MRTIPIDIIELKRSLLNCLFKTFISNLDNLLKENGKFCIFDHFNVPFLYFLVFKLIHREKEFLLKTTFVAKQLNPMI